MKNIQLWLMNFELWQLPLDIWQLPLELWQLPLALWHYSKSKVDVLGTLATASGALATASGALATASRALAIASRTLANISWLSNYFFVFWQLPGISSASSDSLIGQPRQMSTLDSLIRQPYQTASSDSLIRHLCRHLFEMNRTFMLKGHYIHDVVYSDLKWNWLINGLFTTISGHFFSICMFMFPKNWGSDS